LGALKRDAQRFLGGLGKEKARRGLLPRLERNKYSADVTKESTGSQGTWRRESVPPPQGKKKSSMGGGGNWGGILEEKKNKGQKN